LQRPGFGRIMPGQWDAGGGDRFEPGVQGTAVHRRVILSAVRWHLMFPISYRDLELMLLDRGVEVDHRECDLSALLRSGISMSKGQDDGQVLGLDELFESRHFDGEVIVLCVRWYLRFKLFQDLVEMMAERDLSLVHTTIMRWCTAMLRRLSGAGIGSRGRPGLRGATTRPI
jgi:hypothetical protein